MIQVYWLCVPWRSPMIVGSAVATMVDDEHRGEQRREQAGHGAEDLAVVHLAGDGVRPRDDGGGAAMASLEGESALGRFGGDGHAYAFWFWFVVVSSATLSANAVVRGVERGCGYAAGPHVRDGAAEGGVELGQALEDLARLGVVPAVEDGGDPAGVLAVLLGEELDAGGRE